MDIARAITVDSAGFAYVTGVTYSGDLPVTDNAYQRFYQGGGDAWSPSSMFRAVSACIPVISHPGHGEGKRILVDPIGRVAFAGYTTSSVFPVTPNAAQTVFGGGSDAFLSILDLSQSGSAQLSYSTYYGGSDGEVAYDLKRDARASIISGATRFRRICR